MEYPSGSAGAASAFQRGSQVAQDGTAVSFLSFDKGNYRYVVMPVAVKMDAREWWSISTKELDHYGMRVDSRPLQLH